MAEEIVNVAEETQAVSKALIALTKKTGGNKVLVESMTGYTKGYNVDGIYVTDGTNALIVSLNEYNKPYGGDSIDLEEGDPLYNVPSPSMASFDGEWRTDFLIGTYGYAEGTALVEAKNEGWLPAGGEMALIGSLKDEVNALLESVSGTALAEGAYWTSMRFSDDRVWSYDMANNVFTLNNGNVDELAVRPVMSAEGYAEVEA